MQQEEQNHHSVFARTEINEELRRAKQIQGMLLPSAIPLIEGAQLAFIYEPAFVLSGDFVDFYYRMSACELGFFICDVSGHGIPAAIIAAMTKMSMHLWGDYLKEPAGTLQKISRQLSGKLGDEYLTAIMGYLDLKSGELIVSRAGHPPCYVLRQNAKRIEKILPEGSIIHERIDNNLVEYKTTLERGDLIFLYTDGLTEYLDSQGNSLGDHGLEKALQNVTEKNPEKLCAQIFSDHVGSKIRDSSPLLDDITLFAIRFTGQGG